MRTLRGAIHYLYISSMYRLINETNFQLHMIILGASENAEVCKQTLTLYQFSDIAAEEVWIGFDSEHHKYRNYLGYTDTQAHWIEITLTGIDEKDIKAIKKTKNKDKQYVSETMRFYRIQ